MNLRRLIIFIVLPVLIVVLAGYRLIDLPGPDRLPVMGRIRGFELINNRGRPFSAADLDGKVWVANFIFTSCSGVCPMMTKSMKRVQKTFEGRSDIAFVSFSVDPETDTPAVLSEYARRYGANVANWQFLTGRRDAIKDLMFNDFKLGFAEDIMFHSDRMVLLDRDRKIRGYYRGTERGEFDRLAADIRLLLKETR